MGWRWSKCTKCRKNRTRPSDFSNKQRNPTNLMMKYEFIFDLCQWSFGGIRCLIPNYSQFTKETDWISGVKRWIHIWLSNPQPYMASEWRSPLKTPSGLLYLQYKYAPFPQHMYYTNSSKRRLSRRCNIQMNESQHGECITLAVLWSAACIRSSNWQ